MGAFESAGDEARPADSRSGDFGIAVSHVARPFSPERRGRPGASLVEAGAKFLRRTGKPWGHRSNPHPRRLMPGITIECPRCSRKLLFDLDAGVAVVVCPLCQEKIPAESAQELASPVPKPHRRAETGLEFAARSGIDLGETHDPAEPGGYPEAERRLARLRECMPAVPPAYRPNGRMPPAAWWWLVVGLLSGSLTGSLCAAAFAALAAAIAWALAAVLRELSGGSQGVSVGLAGGIAVVVVVVLGYFGACFALGRVAALSVLATGQRGKNRSALATVSAAMLSAALGAFFCRLLLLECLDLANVELEGHETAARHGWLALAACVIGGAIAVVVAGRRGYVTIHTRKFCEPCGRYGTEKRLPAIGLGPLRAVARAVTKREFRAAADLLEQFPAAEGGCGHAQLWRCPCCGGGFLDVTSDPFFTWLSREEECTHRKAWLVASARLDADEMSLFARLMEGQ